MTGPTNRPGDEDAGTVGSSDPSAKPGDAANHGPFPVFEVPAGARPLTPEMVRRAFDDRAGDPAGKRTAGRAG